MISITTSTFVTNSPSEAETTASYCDFVSKSGAVINDKIPVCVIANSEPETLYITVSPSTSFATTWPIAV